MLNLLAKLFNRHKEGASTPSYKAIFQLQDTISTFQVSHAETLTLLVTNEGTELWPSQGSTAVYVGYHWLNVSGQTLVRGGNKVALPQDIKSGEQCEVKLTVIPPNTAGNLKLEFDLFSETQGWFSDLSSPTLQIDCTVEYGQFEDFGEYEDAWQKADLEKDYWSIVGPASREEFEALGRYKLSLLIEEGLTPSSRILDVGCGTGLLTKAVEDYLDSDGLYFGTDIAEKGISFCQKKYLRENFKFAVNQPTQVLIDEKDFDLICLFSVFTHMYPEEIAQMGTCLRELLAPNGVIIADAFIKSQGMPYDGNRAKVDILESALLAAFESASLKPSSAKVVVTEGDVKRVIYRLEATTT